MAASADAAIGADQHLHGTVPNLAADALDLALGHHVAVAQQNDLVGDLVDLVQHVAGDDDVLALRGELAEQSDGFGAHQRIQTVQRLIQHQHRRIVRDGQRQLDPLAHALAVPRDLAIGGVGHAQALDRRAGQAVAFLLVEAEQPQKRSHHLESGEAAREGVELRGVAQCAAQPFGIGGWDAQHVNLAASGPDQTGHQIHQRGLAGAVRADQAGNAGRDRERDRG